MQRRQNRLLFFLLVVIIKFVPSEGRVAETTKRKGIEKFFFFSFLRLSRDVFRRKSFGRDRGALLFIIFALLFFFLLSDDGFIQETERRRRMKGSPSGGRSLWFTRTLTSSSTYVGTSGPRGNPLKEEEKKRVKGQKGRKHAKIGQTAHAEMCRKRVGVCREKGVPRRVRHRVFVLFFCLVGLAFLGAYNMARSSVKNVALVVELRFGDNNGG